jgi:hypothetical protein
MDALLKIDDRDVCGLDRKAGTCSTVRRTVEHGSGVRADFGLRPARTRAGEVTDLVVE